MEGFGEGGCVLVVLEGESRLTFLKMTGAIWKCEPRLTLQHHQHTTTIAETLYRW